VTGSIYLGDLGVDRHQLIFISSYYTTKIHTLSFPTFCGIAWIHANVWIFTAGKYHILSPSSYTARARTPISHEVPVNVAGGAA